MSGKPAGFPATARLARGGDFDRVFAEGRRVATASFTALYRRNGLPYSRLGLAVSRKHLRRAVARNTVRRLVREHFRRRRGEFPGLDVVVLSRPPVAEADRRRLHRELEQLCDRLAARSRSSASRS